MHEIEIQVGGPLKEKVTVSESKPKIAPENQLPESKPKEFEQPGDRFKEFMQTVADEQFVIHHPWLACNKGTPYLLRGIENILCTADSTLKRSATKTVEASNTTETVDAPFTSTSFKGFVWGGLKRLVNPSVRQIGSFFVQALSTFGDNLKQGIRIITGPFIRNRRIIALENSIAALKNLIAQKYNTGKVRLAQATAWALLHLEFVNNLERKIREGHPSSKNVITLQTYVKRYQLGGAEGTGIRVIAENSEMIRALAQKYNGIQRIDPITENSIQNASLRRDLASFAQGWSEQLVLAH